MSEYNSKQGGIMGLHEIEGTITPVDKYRIEKFAGWKGNPRSADDPVYAEYESIKYPAWVLRLDGTDEHANAAMRAYVDSLRGVNDALVHDLLETCPFLAS